MMRRVLTRAFANIALCKYWGKKSDKGNIPATPSISLALQELCTETEVIRLNKPPHRIKINGKSANPAAESRILEYLEFWKHEKLISGFYYINTKNLFPTGAGLASSSSGFAALAKALSVFSKRHFSRLELSRLARIGSGSAARSVTGGLSSLPAGSNPAAKLIMAPEDIPWGMVICTVEGKAKEVASRQGMQLSKDKSPYFNAWVIRARKDYKLMLDAIRRMDFTSVGRICEENMMAMHACMIATRPSLLYWNDTTVRLIKSVRKWREGGLESYCTIDAGPNVAILGKISDLKKIASRARNIKGVKAVKKSLPSGGPSVMESI
jgi:diphosphomevalonate decarboxylase